MSTYKNDLEEISDEEFDDDIVDDSFKISENTMIQSYTKVTFCEIERQEQNCGEDNEKVMYSYNLNNDMVLAKSISYSRATYKVSSSSSDGHRKNIANKDSSRKNQTMSKSTDGKKILLDQKSYVMKQYVYPIDREPYRSYLFGIIKSAEDHFKNGSFQESAKEFYSAILSIQNNWKRTSQEEDIMRIFPSLYNHCIESYIEMNDMDVAVKLSESYLYEFKDTLSPYQALTHCLRIQGNYSEGMNVCNRGISLFPFEASLYSLRGKIHYDQLEYKSALQDFNRSCELVRMTYGDTPNETNALRVWQR